MPSCAAEWAAFVEAINGGRPVAARLDDGVLALVMAEAATLSAQSGKPVPLA